MCNFLRRLWPGGPGGLGGVNDNSLTSSTVPPPSEDEDTDPASTPGLPDPASTPGPPVVSVAFPPPLPPPPESPVSESKRVIQAILSVFETGKPEGDYSACVVLDDGAGISYGKHQATDKGGALDAIVLRYIDKGGSRAAEIKPYVERLAKNETALADPKALPAWVQDLISLLHTAGADPAMRQAQDEVFDERYWTPAVQQWTAMGLVLPLSHCVVYDTCIQSGPQNGVANIRKRFPESPPSGGGDERLWTAAYLRARRAWLAANPNPVVQKTVNRVDVLLGLVSAANWQLTTPITIGPPYRVTVT